MATQESTKKEAVLTRPTTTVVLRYAHIAPRKARLVAHLIQGLSVNNAQAQLFALPNRAARPIEQLLRSAIASAQNKGMKVEDLFVKSAVANKGPMMKRWMPRAMGRATPIHKVMSHITIVLEERAGKGKASRFVIETAKVKKKQKETARAADRTRKTGKAPAHDAAAKAEKDRETKEGTRTADQAQEKGFTKKIFRRKSV
jgi:large subunit ribosomal protein L22